MKTLIVGAGAVGQVYGRHLQLGGAEVSVFVRPKYIPEAKQGYKLYPLNARHPRTAPATFSGFGVVSDLAEVRQQSWDQVYLCVSSTGLRAPMLKELIEAIGPKATLVALQPGIDDREYLLKLVSEDRLVSGLISMISYHAPIPGEKVPEPGMAYWYPPLGPSPFSGPQERTQAVVNLLSKGGLPAVMNANVSTAAAFPGAILMALITALELSDWSFDKLTHGPQLKIACDASRELTAAISKKLGKPAPWTMKLVKPFMVKLLIKLAPHIVPLDVETYLKQHFTKVGDQTRFMMKGYLEYGKQLGVPMPMTAQLEGPFHRKSSPYYISESASSPTLSK